MKAVFTGKPALAYYDVNEPVTILGDPTLRTVKDLLVTGWLKSRKSVLVGEMVTTQMLRLIHEVTCGGEMQRL